MSQGNLRDLWGLETRLIFTLRPLGHSSELEQTGTDREQSAGFQARKAQLPGGQGPGQALLLLTPSPEMLILFPVFHPGSRLCPPLPPPQPGRQARQLWYRRCISCDRCNRQLRQPHRNPTTRRQNRGQTPPGSQGSRSQESGNSGGANWARGVGTRPHSIQRRNPKLRIHPTGPAARVFLKAPGTPTGACASLRSSCMKSKQAEPSGTRRNM